MAEDKEKQEQDGKNSFNLKEFMIGLKAEMKKVIWPTRKELFSYTVIVFIAVMFVCALIWICDTVFSRIIEMILR